MNRLLAAAVRQLHVYLRSGVRAKLHYTNTGYGQAHNNSSTNLPHGNARAQHLAWYLDVANFCPLVVFVGVRC